MQPAPARFFDRLHHITGIPTRADGHQHVSRTAESRHLTGEDGLKAIVIAGRGQQRGIRRQRDGREWLPLCLQAYHTLCGQMLGICRTAPIATP